MPFFVRIVIPFTISGYMKGPWVCTGRVYICNRYLESKGCKMDSKALLVTITVRISECKTTSIDNPSMKMSKQLCCNCRVQCVFEGKE